MGKALLTVLAIVMLVLVLMLVHAQLIVMGKVRPGVSPALAKHSLALLASLGHPSASHMLASMRLFGSSDPDERKLGFAALQQEFETGSCYAAGKLGWAYQRGLAVQPDMKRALSLYEKAADCGMTYWQFLLAHAYDEGYLGLPQDKEKAAYWLKKEPKIHVDKYECWVANYYRDGTFPRSDEKLVHYSAACKK